MNKYIVKSHKFEESKKKLENFSKNLPNSNSLNEVPESALWGFIKFEVQASDINNLIKHYNDKFIKTNASLIKIITEFKTIYETFESLDKDYIQSILIAIKSANEASNQAKENNKKTSYLVNKLQIKFRDIEIQNKLISKDVKTVADISEKLKDIKHLLDIDDTYLQVLENKATLNELKNLFLNLEFEFKSNIDRIALSAEEIRVKQNKLNLDLIEKLKVANENSLKFNKLYTRKLTVVSIIVVLSLILSISMMVKNFMNYA